MAGPVERVSQDEADQYWSTRGPAARLSAAASRQSRVVASRTVLETQVRDILRRHPDGRYRPRRWSGFRVLPSRVEFWQESPDGLHDRIRYRPGRQRLDHRAAVAVTTDGLSNQKTTTIKAALHRHLLPQPQKRGARRGAGASAEATGIYRELAARWPDVYHHELEQSLQVAAWLENGEDLSDASSRESKA